MYQQSIEHLDNNEKSQLQNLLIEFQDVFARDEFDLGNFTEVEHAIDTDGARPVKQRMRKTPVGFAEEEEAHLHKMLKTKVIRPSNSDWASAPVLVRKRDGSVRWCVDWRALNAATVKDSYPLPLVDECVDMLAGNKWFSKLDANSAYWQVRLKPEDCKKTAFTTKYGLYEFIRMGFGLCNAPATFARIMNLVLRGMTWKEVLSFLDDILALGKSFSDHLNTLREVFKRFRQYQLKLKPKKCILFQIKVEFLGRGVGPDGLEMSLNDIQTVKDWPEPQNSKEVERFLGLVNYHRSFIENYAEKARPLYQITSKNKFKWDNEEQKAYCELKEALVSPPILGLPNSRDPFILDTDASDFAIGGVLNQIQDGKERVISYGSFSLSSEQKKYCTTRKELLAVVRFTRQFRHYLLGRSFTIRTDHNSLTWLLRFKEPQGQIARWLEELSQFNMTIVHRPGKDHGNADALSRMQEDEGCILYKAGSKLEELPCKGCKYCVKANKAWNNFEQEVDNVVPLSQVSNEKKLENQQISIMQVLTTWDLKIENVKTEQADEKCFIDLIEWLMNRVIPDDGQLFLLNPEGKYYWTNKECFEIKHGVVWQRDPKRDILRLLVPESLRSEVMYLNHDIPSAGHQGVDRTLSRVKEKYFWRNMTKDIKEYVSVCKHCNKNKKPQRHARYEMTKFHAGAPMEKVHLDFLGPLPKTAAGNEHVLMVVDQFTKWVECIALPNQTSEVTARAVVNNFFCRFGCPFQIVTDRGTNFESKLFKSVCELLQIHKTRTTPYRPSANGQVERYNRTLMDAVRCYVGKHQSSWDLCLPQIAGAIRASVNKNTGFTANKLMLGRETISPSELLYPTCEPPGEDPETYCSTLNSNMKEAHRVARATLGESVAKMKRDYDLRLFSRQYKVGDVVYSLNSATIKGQCKKLGSPWKGPAVVVKVISPYLYKIQFQKDLVTANHDRMKLCKDKEIPAWVRRVKNKALEEGSPEEDSLDNKDEYCLCRGPEEGFMVQCDLCEDWFHGRCVNMSKDEARDRDEYLCPNCEPGSHNP